MFEQFFNLFKNNEEGPIEKNSAEYEACKRAIEKNIPDIILNLKNKICEEPLSTKDKITASITDKITASITEINKYLKPLNTQEDYNDGDDDSDGIKAFVFTRNLLTNIQSFMNGQLSKEKLFANNEEIFEKIKTEQNIKAEKLLEPFKDFLVKDPDCNTITIDDPASNGGKPRSKRSRKNKNTNKKSKNTRRKSIHRRHRR